MEKTLKTFDEWNTAGFKIIKGSKATWVDGVAKFSREQATKNTHKPKSVKRHWAYGLDHDGICDYTGDSFY